MTDLITQTQLRATLDGAGQRYQFMALADGFSLIVTQRGGRIFSFLPDGAPLCWINPVLTTAESFRAAVAEGVWNLGGERIWIAPEVQYNSSDRSRFLETLLFPPQMDPAQYTFDADTTSARLKADMTLQAYNLASGSTTLTVEHHIRTGLPNPLRALKAFDPLMRGVAYAGFMRSVHLATAPTDPLHSESWCLMQLNPGGTMIIPATVADAEVSTYFGDPAPDSLTVSDGAYRLALTGRREYKTGYKAAALTGRLGYLNVLADGRGYLIIRNYFNNPSAIYAEEPPGLPGVNGHSVHAYNGGGDFGQMGELEVTGQTIGGVSGRASSTDDFVLWVFSGAREQLQAIGRVLLGVTL
ncbi:MAG: DUF6786 family protein [Chloroflexota bacterium]|nr:DUF6786 family protein [Chloroflexota bacterium]